MCGTWNRPTACFLADRMPFNGVLPNNAEAFVGCAIGVMCIVSAMIAGRFAKAEGLTIAALAILGFPVMYFLGGFSLALHEAIVRNAAGDICGTGCMVSFHTLRYALSFGQVVFAVAGGFIASMWYPDSKKRIAIAFLENRITETPWIASAVMTSLSLVLAPLLTAVLILVYHIPVAIVLALFYIPELAWCVIFVVGVTFTIYSLPQRAMLLFIGVVDSPNNNLLCSIAPIYTRLKAIPIPRCTNQSARIR